MIFEYLGRFATRYRVPIIVAWVAAAAIVTLVAPDMADVASSDLADFLPSDAPFKHASALYEELFPNDNAEGSSVIVFDARQSAEGVLNPDASSFEAQLDTEAGRFIRAFTDWANSDAAPEVLDTVTSPTQLPALAALLVAGETSTDPLLINKVALVRVNMTETATEPPAIEAMHEIDAWLEAHRPPSVRAYQTGASPLVYSTSESVVTSADRAIWVTVVLVIFILLAVYRSPVSPLIPLSAVTLAFLITRGIVAWLGANHLTITTYANVLLITVMYGAGTDYCLFLISRFREEMADHPGIEAATAHTVHRVGETITSSAGTIFVGFMAMVFAEMGIFNTTGPALALGIVMSLLAGLTLVPALLATLGDRAFWPRQATHRGQGRLYAVTSKWVSTRPLVVILVIVALMMPLSVYGLSQHVTYDLLDDLPDDKPIVTGFLLLQDSLGAGNTMPLTVVVTGRDPDRIAADIVRLSDEIAALDGIFDVRGLDDPLGQGYADLRDVLHVSAQLRLALGMIGDAEQMSAFAPAQAGAALAGMQSYVDLLAERFPEVADDPNLVLIRDLLANPLQLLARQDELAAAVEGLAARFETVNEPYLMPTALIDLLAGLPATGDGLDPALAGQLATTYLAAENTAFKLDIILSVSPSSDAALDTVSAIRRVLKGYQDGGEAVVSGGSAVNADIRDTMNRDLLRAIGFVLLGIFIVLLLMLRSVVAPLYLIGTVVLSFTFTLGLTNLVFKTLLGVAGLTWYVPFFSFVFLVALGIDYSIFLFGRIKEEVGYHGLREGVHVAVATTGAIITSAGIILSGTFAALLTGEVAGLLEIGFAVAVGVLIDTFVVRTVLDPALAALFGRWTWWPGGVPRATSRRTPHAPAPEAGD
ncbi:MAG: MMPL family transporter [Chloroflexota bacterium]